MEEIFTSKDDAEIDMYFQNEEVQAKIILNASVAALIQILIEENITTEDYFNKIKKLYEEAIIKGATEKIKKELNIIKEEE